MPKTAPQFFRFKAKEIASRRRDRSGPSRVQLTTKQTGQPFTFKTSPRDRTTRPALKPEIYGPYKKRKHSQKPALLTPVGEAPTSAETRAEVKPKKVWVSKDSTGRLSDLAVASAKIIIAGLCGSALICTIRELG